MKYTPKEFIVKHRGDYHNHGEFIRSVKHSIADLKEFEEDNVHQIKYYEEVLAELRSTNPIYGIIERKKQGTDCTEAESAEVKGWLRDIEIPFEQPTFNEVKELFPIEYNEFLEEVEIQYKDSLEKFYNDEIPKPERKYYLIRCYETNLFRDEHMELSDAEFIALAEAAELVFTEAEFVKLFNDNSVLDNTTQYLRII